MSGFEPPEFDTSSSSSEESEELFPYYNPSTTYYILDVKYDNENPQPKYDPIFLIDDITKFGPSVELPNNIDSNAVTLAELWLPDHLSLDQWVKATNEWYYRRDISCKADILRFLATISDMHGVVSITCKDRR
jgi:hypothetical protein